MGKRLAIFALKAAVSAGLFWFILSRIDVEAVGERLLALGFVAAGVLLAILFAQAMLATLRWLIVSNAAGLTLRFRSALVLLFVGLFFNQALISSLGGDAVRVWRLHRAGAGMGLAVRSVLLDRLAALGALLIMIAASLPVLFDAVPNPAARLGIVSVLGAGALGFASLLVLDRAPVLIRRGRLGRLLAALAVAARRVFLSGRTVFPVLGLSIATHAISASVVFLVARHLGLSAPPLGLFVLTLPVILFSALPISVAGWGVREGTMVAALSFLGVPAADAFAVSVIYGLALLAIALPGGALSLLATRVGRADGAPAGEARAAFSNTRAP